MTARDGFEQTVSTFLHAEAPAREPEYLGEVAATLRGTRQRPAWTNPDRWLGGVVAPWTPARVPRAAWLVLALALLLLVATALGIVAVGQRPTTFPWSGPGANGLIAFEYEGRIAVANADWTNRRFLTAPAGVSAVGVPPDGSRCCDGSMAWSPDGGRLAFLRSVGREAGWPVDDLMVVDADGSNLRVLAAGLTPFRTYGRGAEGSQALVAPAWSPDTKFLALSIIRFDAAGNQWNGVVIIDAVTGKVRDKLRAAFRWTAEPAWSPDGEELAFTGASTDAAEPDGIYIAQVDGSGVRKISTSPGPGGASSSYRWPTWTPDGRSIIAVNRATGNIVRLAADGSGEVPIGTAVDGTLAISPDGQQVAYFNGRTLDASGSWIETVAIIDLSTGASRVLPTSGLQLSYPLVWSPDGRRVLVVPAFGATVQLWAVDATGSGAPVELSIGPISSRVLDDGTTTIGDGWDRELTFAWQRVAP